MFECNRCGYETPRKHNLTAHLQRRIPCDPLVKDVDVKIQLNELTKKEKPFSCSYCKECFSSLSSKYRHQSRCDHKQTNTLQEQTQTRNYDTLPQTINNIQINQNININIKSFGCENLSYVEANRELLSQCFLNRDLKSLIENIHCDRQHPENHNVRIKSRKDELMETYIDGKWIVSDCEETLTDLIQKGYRIINLYSHSNKRDLISECDDEEEYSEIRDWFESVFEDQRKQKPLKKQLMILFMNNKMLLLGKD